MNSYPQSPGDIVETTTASLTIEDGAGSHDGGHAGTRHEDHGLWDHARSEHGSSHVSGGERSDGHGSEHGGGGSGSTPTGEVSITLQEVTPCSGPTGTAQLVAIDFMSGRTTVLGSWPSHPEWDRHTMTVDVDGSVLIASSDTLAGKHGISRLDVRHAHAVTVLGQDVGVLAFPVVADPDGYTVVTFAEPIDGTVQFQRLKSLQPSHGCGDPSLTLGDQL